MSERLLRKNLYGSEREPAIGPFGLMTGQMHAERGFGHNSGLSIKKETLS